MRVALIQFNATADKPSNIRRALLLVEQAFKSKATFVLLPEIFNWRGDSRHPEKLKVAESIPGESSTPFMALALQYQSHILLGSLLEKSNDPTKMHNTSVLINPAGEITAKYRKIHLFDAKLDNKIVREADCFIAGNKRMVARVDAFTVGLSICYDVRFPDLYNAYAKAGANLLVVPSCFMKATGQAHWETLIKARAIENLAYVLAPNQVGLDGRGMEAFGHSMIVSPWGDVIAKASHDQEEIIMADISIDAVTQARAQLPSLIKVKR